ncbi:MAG: hypothetical protein AB7N76_10585 [Planctomycetota bacterium]
MAGLLSFRFLEPFKLYALDAPLELAPGAEKKALLAAMEGHVLGQGELTGTYERKK